MISGLPLDQNIFGMPGQSDVLTSVENQVWFGPRDHIDHSPVRIDGASRDVGNTSYTTELRAGLLMGTVRSTGMLRQWSPLATDGSEAITHVLTQMIPAQQSGTNVNRWGYALRLANLKQEGLIVPGVTDPGLEGTDLEFLAAHQLLDRGFKLNKVYHRDGHVHRPVAATATLTTDDAGKLITDLGASGATVLTIPDPLPGLDYHFACMIASGRSIQPVSVDKIISINEAGNAYAATTDDIELTGLGSSVTLRGIEFTGGVYKYIVTGGIRFTADDAR